MAELQIARHTPVACAGCFGQYPERVHIDFRSAIEGPPVNASPRAPHIEWVVMCEHCIRTAFDMLPKQADARENLGRQIAQLRERAEAAENYASSLEVALAHRPEDTKEPKAPRKVAQHKPKPAAVRRNRYAA